MHGRALDMTVADALALYYVHAGLPSDGGAQAKWFRVHVGPVAIPLPNPPARRRAVFYHDVNHLLTGYDNVFSRGEMAIAGYELRSGCGPYWIAWLINFGMFAMGLACCPRMLFEAFLRGRDAASTYRRGDRSRLATMSVEQLRRELGVPPVAPPARLGDVLGFAVMSIVSVTVLVAPLLIALGTRVVVVGMS